VLADKNLDQIDAESLQVSIRDFFREYEWVQHGIANLNVLAKMDLRNMDAVRKWLEEDRFCFTQLEQLKTWKEASAIRGVTDISSAYANDVNWTKINKVNY
jgi:hypothetical protein